VVDLSLLFKSSHAILPSEYAPQTEGTIDVREIGKDQYTLDIANLYLIPANKLPPAKSPIRFDLGNFQSIAKSMQIKKDSL
jgi:hypothetical protein